MGPLIKVAVPLPRYILAPLRITAAASAIDAGIQKKIHGSGKSTLITSNKEINDIMNIVQVLEYSNILLNRVTKRIKNETKKREGGFLGVLLGTLGSILSGNMLEKKGIVREGSGGKKKKELQELVMEKNGILMPPHPLTNFEIQKYYQNEPRFNDVYSRNNLAEKIKDEA